MKSRSSFVDVGRVVRRQRVVRMKASLSPLLSSLLVAGIISATSTSAAANPRPACDVLPLAEVRALVGSPVSVFDMGLSAPATRGDTTYATCVYAVLGASGHPIKGRGAKFSLMWAPKAKLAQVNDFYTKRHIEAPGIKGDVLVLAWVGNPSGEKAGDWSASSKLLASVLQKL